MSRKCEHDARLDGHRFFRLKLLLNEVLNGVLFALGQAEHRCVQPRCGAEGESVDNVRGEVDRPCLAE